MNAPKDANSTNLMLADCRRSIQDRLAKVRGRLKTQLIIEGLAWALGTAVGLATLSLICDRLIKPDLTVRITLLAVAFGAIVYVAIRRLYQPVTLRLDDLDLAELLERRQRGIGQRLANVLLLPQLQQQDSSASPAMIQAAVREDFAVLETVDLQKSFNEDRRRNVWLLLLGLIVPVGLFCFANPATASLWARRWFAGAEIRWPQQTYLSVSGLEDADRLRVPRGEAYLLQVDAQPEFTEADGYWKINGRGTPLVIEGRQRPVSTIPESVTLKLTLADRSQRQGTFTHYSAGQFRYELPPLFDSAEITVAGGDDWFGPLIIEPIDRPSVDGLTITARTPGRTEPEIYHSEDAQKQLLFLPATQLELAVQSDQVLASAAVSVSGTETNQPLQRRPDGQYLLTWEMKEPVTFEFQLMGESGLASKPYFLTLGILNDRPPRLTLRSSGIGRRITPVAKIPLHLRAIDDFGVAELSLELEETHIVESKPITASHSPLKEKFEASDSTRFPLDVNREPMLEIEEFSLNPGTAVRIRGRASDACVLGVQTAESRWLSFQVVTPEELFYEILTRQREQRSRFAKALEAAKNQRDALVKMASTGEVSAIVRSHQGITRQVWQIAGQLDATLQEMTLNDLGTSAGRELLQTSVIQPLRDLHDRPLAELLKKLSSVVAGESIDDDRREVAIEAQTETVQLMQRILDQMSQWESFVDVVNQLRHVIDSQNKIRDSTEEMQKTQIKDVFDQ
jgi:hypothetical protein